MSSTVRFGKRSAATPPHGVAISIAMPNASITPPSPALLPVRSLASQPRATDWPITPKITAAALMKSRRKPSDSITEWHSSDPRGRAIGATRHRCQGTVAPLPGRCRKETAACDG